MATMRPLSPAGVAAAVALAPLAAIPSLIPRAAPIQGLLLGLLAMLGYAAGTTAGVAVARIRGDWRWNPGRGTRRAGIAVGLTWVAGWILAGHRWQQDLAALMGTEPPGWGWVTVSLVVAAALAALVLLVARGVRVLMLRGRAVVARRAREPIPSLAVGAVVVVAAVPVLTGSAGQVLLALLNPLFLSANAGTGAGVQQPATTGVSGRPGSAVAWQELGRDGREFIASTPSRQSINSFSGGGAARPIRVYVGVSAANSAQDRARLAVAELQRFGAFERQILAVGTSTGTGTVDGNAVLPLELMYNGDTAAVSTQYSVLPSFLSFLFDRGAAEDEARALFAAVHERWSALPRDHRPRLLVFGESLGAYGATAPFPDLADFGASVDGALLAGPPNATPLWRRYTELREAGSPERLPVHNDGTPLRWAATPPDYSAPASPWGPPRLAYLQNASDPVVWWSPRLLWSRPDWLTEERGSDVLPGLPWLPLITFLGLSGDMINSTSVGMGHGHVYGTRQAAAWARIVPPSGWTSGDTDRLEAALGG
jgi:uncharacterized membrane protein